MRSDPSLATFIEEMPHLEAAARGLHRILSHALQSNMVASFRPDNFGCSAVACERHEAGERRDPSSPEASNPSRSFRRRHAGTK